VNNLPNPKQKRQKVLSKIDQKVIEVLQKEKKTLTLQEIANKTGEAPQKIAKSLWKLFAYNEKLINEMLLQIYL
jgi:cyanate lyase